VKIVNKSGVDYQRHSKKVLAQRLTRRRLKAERYEKRHPEELVKEENEIFQRVLGYVPKRVDRCIEGNTWTVSGHEVPDIDEEHVMRRSEVI
jgi:hypothetical protein